MKNFDDKLKEIRFDGEVEKIFELGIEEGFKRARELGFKDAFTLKVAVEFTVAYVLGFMQGIATETARNVRRRFGNAAPSEFVERVEAVVDYTTLEKIGDYLFVAKDFDDFRRFVETLLS